MKVVSKLSLFLVPALVLLLPIFFLPITTNIFATPKLILIMVATLLLFLAYGIEAILSRRILLPSSPLTLPLILIIAAVVVNLIVYSQGRTEGLAGIGAILLSLSALALLVLTHPSPHTLTRYSLLTLIASTTILAVASLAQLTFIYQSSFVPQFMASRTFSLAGSPLVAVFILVVGSLATLGYVLKTKGLSNYLFMLALGIELIAIVAYISLMLPGQPLATIFLPYSASWSIFLDGAKSVKTIFLGIGLNNFPLLYAAVKPLFLNNTAFWNITPSSASSEVFGLLITGGLVLTGAVFYLVSVIASTLRKLSPSPDSLALTLTLSGTIISLFLLPASVITYALLFIFGALAVSIASSTQELGLSHPVQYVVGGVIIVGSALASYYFGRLILADNHMYKAQQAIVRGDAKATYDEHIKAISLVPTMTSYRLSYSQVNLTLASSLSQKTDLTDADRTQITTLVQQALREAQAVASLRPGSSQSWQNLGNIYKNLINVAEGSDKFALDYYGQAVAVDPGNPSLRVEYGGLFYQLAKTTKDEASKATYLTRAAGEFQTAIQLKGDYSNAYYNLGKTLEEAGNIPLAISAMEKVTSLVDPSSQDYQTATSELSSLKSKSATPSAAKEAPITQLPPADSTELTEPSPLPSPIAGGPIILPEETTAPVATPNP